MFHTALISLFLTSTALATTWTVDDDGKADFDNIQAAVDAASDGDEIVVMPGTYTSDEKYVLYLENKLIEIHSSDGPEATVLDGESLRTVVRSTGGSVQGTILNGFTITGGYASTSAAGLSIGDGSISVTNCVITNNHATGSGAGLLAISASPVFIQCTFYNNHSENEGGGAYVGWGFPQFIECVFDSNFASNGGGGILCIQGHLILENCMFLNNDSKLGGGVKLINCRETTTINRCMFINNIAISGAGIHNNQQVVNLGMISVQNSSFEDNQSNNGGGIEIVGYSDFSILQSRFCNNTESDIMGEWENLGGNRFIENCRCFSDINLDQVIDLLDLLIVIGYWNTSNTPGDVTFNGIVDVSDLLMVVGNWGPCE